MFQEQMIPLLPALPVMTMMHHYLNQEIQQRNIMPSETSLKRFNISISIINNSGMTWLLSIIYTVFILINARGVN